VKTTTRRGFRGGAFFTLFTLFSEDTAGEIQERKLNKRRERQKGSDLLKWQQKSKKNG
jgi:hypothetical protein